MTVSCNRKGCDRTWEMDPILEVECPTCEAGIDARCKRPSGHSGPLVDYHQSRDTLAVKEGYYGECPLGIYAETLAEMDHDADFDPGKDDIDASNSDDSEPESRVLTPPGKSSPASPETEADDSKAPSEQTAFDAF